MRHLSTPDTRHHWAPWAKLALSVLAGLLVVALAGTVVATVKLSRNGDAVDLLPSLTDDPVSDDLDGRELNILLIGSDAREGENTDASRSDSLLLAHVSADRSRIDAVQIPRDTIMDRPTCESPQGRTFAGSRGMINAMLGYGPACSVRAVESLTGVPVDHLVEIRFEGFEKVIDAIGGLPIHLDEAMQDKKAKLDLPAGDQVLDGRNALALARTRHAVGDGSDIARLGNQQWVMSEIIRQVKDQRILARPDRTYAFLDAVTSSLVTDTGLRKIPRALAVAGALDQVPEQDINFHTMPWDQDPLNPNRVVPAPEAAEVFAALGHDRPVPALHGR